MIAVRGVAALLALCGCGKLRALDDTVTPLASVRVSVSGDAASLAPAGTTDRAQHLRAALVWGAQWQPEPFCFLPAESDGAARVIAAGCRDLFGFVPLRVAVDAPLGEGGEVTLSLLDLPAADDLVGDLTARIAYGSVVVYDDRNDNGALDFGRAGSDRNPGPRIGGAGGPQQPEPPPGGDRSADLVYGASFVSMERPDVRVAYREGAFNLDAAFYPRAGCEPPPPGFSLARAGGFSRADALAAVLSGMLPAEDPATCSVAALPEAAVGITLEAPAGLVGVVCASRGGGGGTRYKEPPRDAPPLAKRIWACASVPVLDLGGLGGGGLGGGGLGSGGSGGSGPQQQQLVIADPPPEEPTSSAPGAVYNPTFNYCKGLTHYVLRGCNNDASCKSPQWDRTSSPPAWWPCPVPQ